MTKDLNIDPLSVKDAQGMTALHIGARYGDGRVMQSCTEQRGLVFGEQAKINDGDNFGWTPLHYATEFGHSKIIQVLSST